MTSSFVTMKMFSAIKLAVILKKKFSRFFLIHAQYFLGSNTVTDVFGGGGGGGTESEQWHGMG